MIYWLLAVLYAYVLGIAATWALMRHEVDYKVRLSVALMWPGILAMVMALWVHEVWLNRKMRRSATKTRRRKPHA